MTQEGKPYLPWTHPNAPLNVRCFPDRLKLPLQWREPRMVFVNSRSDLFHEAVPREFRAEVWDVMREAKRHVFQVLTKRPENIPHMLPPDWGDGYPNVWLGASVENQTNANRRIPPLLNVHARIRFLSCEPLLGPVDLSTWLKYSPINGRNPTPRGDGLQSRYEGRPEYRFEGPGLEGCCEPRSWEREIISDDRVPTAEGGAPGTFWLSPGESHVRFDTILRSGPPIGLSPLQWPDTRRIDRQSQERPKVGQSAKQPRTSDAIWECGPRASCAQSRATGPTGRGQCHGEANELSGLGDSETQTRRGVVEGYRGALRGVRQGHLKDLPWPALGISWVICGGESGPRSRPMELDWARSLRDACAAVRIPFFLKQLGGWPDARSHDKAVIDGRTWTEMPSDADARA